MRSCLCTTSTAVLLACAPAHAHGFEDPDEDDDVVRWSELLNTGVKFDLYGFLRADVQYADSRFNDVQIPGFVQSEDPTAPAAVGAENNDGDFSLHPRLTRFGIDLMGPEIEGLCGPDVTGTVEIDFYNIGLGDSDSRAAIRIRKGYVQLSWDHVSVLAGQTGDVISPLYPAVNADLVMWGAGNTGDRRPQVRAEVDAELGPGAVTATLGIGLSGAVSGPAAEGGLRSGENSGEPMVSARVGFAGDTESGGAFQLGIWGHRSAESFDALGDGTDQYYASWSAGLDARVPLYCDRLWVLGEYWHGENVDDVRGGIFQGVNPTTGSRIESHGGFVELGARAGEHTTLHAGLSIDDPKNGDLNVNQRSKNEVVYGAARWRYGVVGFGIEYLHWTTRYLGLEKGDASRAQGYLAYYF